jgi:ATP-dependent helicase HrpA
MADPTIEQLKALLPRCRLTDWNRLGARLIQALRESHGTVSGRLLDSLLREAGESAAACERRRQLRPTPTYAPDLPITVRRDEIVDALRRHQVVVIAGETGSGKTTQIPKMCLEAGLGIEGMIGCTQPRRVAATSISQRVAEELNVNWGHEVGCKIRFDDRTGPDTLIKFMTDGILLAETQGDPLMSEYNAIIIDEAHERSLNIDFLLGYLKGLLARRADLKLVITSATIDTGSFSRAFGDAPVIEVSGRMYPVTVRYAPADEIDPEDGTGTYVEAAAQWAARMVHESTVGDILIFMPSERDIRETVDLVAGRCGSSVEVIPLYGRLSNADQQRVFAPSSRRKIIVATNLAETSLTLPGIRYVIDTGLARISRYDSRTRTKRLPIEPIAQSSANQRRGRAGRVQAGVCIRLYSEEEFLERPEFTQPEIQRANLAEVILRMKAYHLGEIETFPFVNPPPPAAIQAGFTLLAELGALDEQRNLTPLGRDLARLPIDPTLGRMLLQACQEGSWRELLTIAAGLSVVDPRERPSDQTAAADAAHRRYVDPRSDFMSLLHLWSTVEQDWKALRTSGQQRRYCRTQFLSYLRLREWQELREQLAETLDPLIPHGEGDQPASYDAIHRAITTGLLGHLACRVSRNMYRGAGNRELMVFPGSSLFRRTDKSDGPARVGARDLPANASGEKSGQPQWIVSGEIVQTSQLFARMVAEVNPEWVVELAPQLCKRNYINPRWDPSAGKVLATERWTLFGLEICLRTVAFGNVDPGLATEIFIRSALVEESTDQEEGPANRSKPSGGSKVSLTRKPPDPPLLAFVESNRQVCQRVATWRTRVRQPGLIELDEALYRFYRRQLPDMSSFAELHRWLREAGNPDRLLVSEPDLAGRAEIAYDTGAFPDQVQLGTLSIAAEYAYAPGEEVDGVTLRLPVAQAVEVSPAAAAWAIPGWRAELADELLRGLPKTLRRGLMPLPPKAAEIAREFRPSGTSLPDELSRFMRQKFGVEIPATAWKLELLPRHLLPRIEIVGPASTPLLSGRDLALLQSRLGGVLVQSTQASGDWDRLKQRWERFGLTEWTLDELPEKIPVGDPALGQFAWPGVEVEEHAVNLRLFASPAGASRANARGVPKLIELGLARELAWLERDLRGLARCAVRYAPLGTPEQLQTSALRHLIRHVVTVPGRFRLRKADFEAAVASARERLKGLALPFMDQVANLLELRHQVAARVGGSPAAPAPSKARIVTAFDQLAVVTRMPAASPWAAELHALMPPDFLEVIPHHRLIHLPRYLKALQTRIERASLQPDKEQARRLQLAPYLEALGRWRANTHLTPEAGLVLDEYRWMVEEFRVSLFAQELGTPVPVSPKRLDQLLARLAELAPAKMGATGPESRR